MRWYTDGSHFKPLVGSMMLQRIYQKPTDQLPADFGRRLEPDMINATLADIRTRRDRYAATHPDEVREAGRWAPK